MRSRDKGVNVSYYFSLNIFTIDSTNAIKINKNEIIQKIPEIKLLSISRFKDIEMILSSRKNIKVNFILL